jgi:hypothetical protein
VLPAFTYVRPASLREAIRAGGTDLLGCLRDARGTPLSPESPSP